MQYDFRSLIEFARHDPLAILGFGLVGGFAVVLFHIQSRMNSAGFKINFFGGLVSNWRLPAEYLKARKQHHWPAWPAYLVWPCLIAGIVLLVIGLFRLAD